MTSQVPSIPGTWNGWLIKNLTAADKDGLLHISDAGAATLASLGFFCFLAGRFSGAAILKKFSAHKVLGLYALLNVILCGLIFLQLGWLSVACVFLSYFFMSIMFPTIFALGIHGLGARAKKASAYIVMAIMGGAIVPKLMGAVGDHYGMSRAFIVPLACFVFIAYYGYNWSKFSKVESINGTIKTGGH
jgi:FHS family L-fucose permease-like MFS transporter